MGSNSIGESILERWTDCFLLVMLAVFPLWTGANGYLGITYAKYVFFRAAAGIYLVGMMVIFAELIFIGVIKHVDIRSVYRSFSLSQKFILLYLVAALISALLSDYSQVVWLGNQRYEGVFTQLLYVGIFWGVASYGRLRTVHLLAFALAISLNSILVTAQIMGFNPFGLYPPGLNFHDRYLAYTGEFLGTIGNSDLLSALLTIAVPLLVCGYMREMSRWRWLLLFSAASGWWALLLSGVSGGLVGIVVGVFLVIPVLMSDEHYQQRSLRGGMIFSLVTALFLAFEYSYIEKKVLVDFSFTKGTLIFLVAGIALYFLPTVFRGKHVKHLPYLIQSVLLLATVVLIFCCSGTTGLFYEASQILRGNVLDSFGSYRIAIWRNVLALIPTDLFFGGGPDTLEFRLSLLFESTMASGVLLKSPVDVAHNEYLNILANTGLISLVAYLAALLAVLMRWKRWQNFDKSLLFLGLPLLCYCIQAFFGIAQCFTAVYFWIIFGLFENKLRKGRLI